MGGLAFQPNTRTSYGEIRQNARQKSGDLKKYLRLSYFYYNLFQ
jgi:hypothetical protein